MSKWSKMLFTQKWVIARVLELWVTSVTLSNLVLTWDCHHEQYKLTGKRSLQLKLQSLSDLKEKKESLDMDNFFGLWFSRKFKFKVYGSNQNHPTHLVAKKDNSLTLNVHLKLSNWLIRAKLSTYQGSFALFEDSCYET